MRSDAEEAHKALTPRGGLEAPSRSAKLLGGHARLGGKLDRVLEERRDLCAVFLAHGQPRQEVPIGPSPAAGDAAKVLARLPDVVLPPILGGLVLDGPGPRFEARK